MYYGSLHVHRLTYIGVHIRPNYFNMLQWRVKVARPQKQEAVLAIYLEHFCMLHRCYIKHIRPIIGNLNVHILTSGYEVLYTLHFAVCVFMSMTSFADDAVYIIRWALIDHRCLATLPLPVQFGHTINDTPRKCPCMWGSWRRFICSGMTSRGASLAEWLSLFRQIVLINTCLPEHSLSHSFSYR